MNRPVFRAAARSTAALGVFSRTGGRPGVDSMRCSSPSLIQRADPHRGGSPNIAPRGAGASHVPTRKTRKGPLSSSPSGSPSTTGATAPVSGSVPPSLPSTACMCADPGTKALSINGKTPVLVAVPAEPPRPPRYSTLSNASGIGACEAYSKDEEQLNNFIRLHPMLSLLRLAFISNS